LVSYPTKPPAQFFTAADGVRLAWHELGPENGNGRPVVLIHGLFSDAYTNWVRYGHAALLVERGFRVIMPDLRAHGDSACPHDAAAYPPDVLADDGFALVDHLGLTDFDLGGYSLGGRTVARMLVRGAAPRRAIISGMGLAGLLDTGHRAGFFKKVLAGIGTHERGSPEFMAEAFLKTTKGDPKALLPLLDSFVDSSREQIGAIVQPLLVVSGEDDHDNGSAAALAAAVAHGRAATVPGNHMSAVTRPELGRAIAAFLSEPE